MAWTARSAAIDQALALGPEPRRAMAARLKHSDASSVICEWLEARVS
jgi:hypothetical protein